MSTKRKSIDTSAKRVDSIDMSLRQLRARARDLNIPRYARMQRAELIWCIAAHEEYDARDDGEKSYGVGVQAMRKKMGGVK